MTFAELGLSPETLRAVEDSGYTTPTPIQEQAIPWVLQGRDVLGIAQTGTGKTASFTLPMIDILASGRAKARMPRSLILAPTRELANQVAENFTKYGKHQKLNMALLIGGESFTEQNKVLERGVDVLIATPGRLMDLFDRGKILLRDVKVLVIDEADRMLDMGFIPDVERIVGLLPPLRQTLFFSATMDKAIRKLADAFLHNPKEVKVDPGTSAAETVTQEMVIVDHVEKRDALRHVLRLHDVRNAFIFCNRKRDVGVLYKSLTKHGFDVVQLHGDMPQSERTATLARFKAGEVKLMVCSDVAARGIDIADVSHVFNFDVPIHSEDYVHRIGRTGRAGREGRAFTIATPDDTRYVAAIEKLIGKEIPRIVLEGIETRDLSEGDGEGAGGRDRRGGGRDRGKRRSRDRERGPRREEAVEAAVAAPEAPVALVAPAAEPAQPEAAAESPPPRERDRGDRGRDRGDRRRDRGDRTERGGDRGGDRQRRGRRFDPAWTDVDEMRHADDVMAFGDHAPAFLFAPTTGTEARAIEEAARASRGETPGEEKKSRRRRGRKADAVEAEAPVVETEAQEPAEAQAVEEAPAAEPAAKPKRKRPARSRKAAAEAPADAPAEVAPEAPAEADVTAELAQAEMPEAPEAPAEEKPKRKRPSRAKKGAEEPAAEAAPEAEGATEEKPKRTRARKPKATEAAPAAEDKPKRKRPSRAKKAAEAPAAEPAPAEESSEG